MRKIPKPSFQIPLSEEEPSTSVAETLDSTSIAVVGVSRVHEPPHSGKDPPIISLSPEEEEEIDLAEKRETITCKDGVACKDIDAGKEASEDIDSERQGIVYGSVKVSSNLHNTLCMPFNLYLHVSSALPF